MLHRLSPPAVQVEENLFALVGRQRQLLHFACSHTDYDEGAFRSELGDSFADWIQAGRHSCLLDDFKQLISCATVDKRLVLADFNHDQKFWEQSDSATFQFAFSPSKTAAHQHAKECLNAFYKSLNSLARLLPVPQQFKRKNVVDGYIATNPFLARICPCCEGDWSEQVSRSQTPYTLEHFFHKGEHPTICLHPYNLIPMCDVCNSRRGNKEMLHSETGTYIGIDKIFHPLLRPAIECVELQYYSIDLNKPEKLKFVNLPTQLDDWSEAIEGYNFVYEIPKRWQERWNEIDGIIATQVRVALNAHYYSQQSPISRIDFERILSGIILGLNKSAARYHYPAQRWLTWAKQYKLQDLYEAHVMERGLHLSNAL
ncbi:MAG: hypothetical protein AAF614_39050 [Chloroflexota bacterium]